MLTPSELRTLDAVLVRLVPDAATPDVGLYVRSRAALQPDLYRAGLIVLQSRGFEGLEPEARDRFLGELEAHPSVALMVQHAVEGFYTSPEGLASVGFRVTA